MGFKSANDMDMAHLNTLAFLVIVLIGLLLVIEKEGKWVGAVPVPARREK